MCNHTQPTQVALGTKNSGGEASGWTAGQTNVHHFFFSNLRSVGNFPQDFFCFWNREIVHYDETATGVTSFNFDYIIIGSFCDQASYLFFQDKGNTGVNDS